LTPKPALANNCLLNADPVSDKSLRLPRNNLPGFIFLPGPLSNPSPNNKLATQLIFEYFVDMSDRCNFSHWLALEGLRATPVRLAVLEILGEASPALRAQEILEVIRVRRRVNKVTVYRILEDFTRRSMVRKLSLEGRVNHFELACEHHPPHPHFQCQTCREVQCLEPVALNRMWSELQGPVGNRADHIDIKVEGLCHKCRDISSGN
jgi:Fur family transcriptional regulator, ferric uptake regulator